jgi:formamidopyrimidine-DNA glycosylase
MPELPEVETVRRGLEPVLVGRVLTSVEQRRPDLRFPFPDRFVARLVGQRVERLERRAKYLRAHLSGGEVLVMHLGMSGRFTIARELPPPLWGRAGEGGNPERLPSGFRPSSPTPAAGSLPPLTPPDPGEGDSTRVLGEYRLDVGADPRHDHVVLDTDADIRITYNDPRRFGFMLLVPKAELDAHPLFAALGVEPLDPAALTPDYLARRAAGRTADLKAFLMDQCIVAGLGNIYVSEALFRAGLSPQRPAGSLARARGAPTAGARRLAAAIRSVLEDAIAAGGSTLRDFAHADGALGRFQDRFSTYGRAGEPCARPGCRGIVQRSVRGGRSTYFCSACQR